MTIEKRIELVRNAILRAREARRSWQLEEMCAASTSDERMAARSRMITAEREFGWQIDNVEAILDHYLEVERTAQNVVDGFAEIEKNALR